MVHVRKPIIHSVSILDLRPTRMMLGLREVRAKRQAWRDWSSGLSVNQGWSAKPYFARNPS
jgi:hypothetical protein